MQLLSNFFFIVSNSLLFIASVDVILSSKRLDSRCTYVAFNCCIVNKYLIYYYSNCIIFLQSIDKHSILVFFFSPRHIYFIVPGWQLKFLLFFVNYVICNWPVKLQPRKMVKHTQKICRQQPTNCLSVLTNL